MQIIRFGEITKLLLSVRPSSAFHPTPRTRHDMNLQTSTIAAVVVLAKTKAVSFQTSHKPAVNQKFVSRNRNNTELVLELWLYVLSHITGAEIHCRRHTLNPMQTKVPTRTTFPTKMKKDRLICQQPTCDCRIRWNQIHMRRYISIWRGQGDEILTDGDTKILCCTAGEYYQTK